jgi:hypothetical protein
MTNPRIRRDSLLTPMIIHAIRRLGGIAYRLAFLTAGLYLFWPGATDTDGPRMATSIGLGSLCLLQFLVLALIDYRRGKRRRRAP